LTWDGRTIGDIVDAADRWDGERTLEHDAAYPLASADEHDATMDMDEASSMDDSDPPVTQDEADDDDHFVLGALEHGEDLLDGLDCGTREEIEGDPSLVRLAAGLRVQVENLRAALLRVKQKRDARKKVGGRPKVVGLIGATIGGPSFVRQSSLKGRAGKAARKQNKIRRRGFVGVG
jgi:hypothetical protein